MVLMTSTQGPKHSTFAALIREEKRTTKSPLGRIQWDSDRPRICQVEGCENQAVVYCVVSSLIYCSEHRHPHGTHGDKSMPYPHPYRLLHPGKTRQPRKGSASSRPREGDVATGTPEAEEGSSAGVESDPPGDPGPSPGESDGSQNHESGSPADPSGSYWVEKPISDEQIHEIEKGAFEPGSQSQIGRSP